jgi:hypothetical protein
MPSTPDPALFPTLEVATVSSYGGGQIAWDEAAQLWTGCLTRAFTYPPNTLCGGAAGLSGTAIIRVELSRDLRVVLRWNSPNGVCAADGTCEDTMMFHNLREYAVTSQDPWKAAATYSPMSDTLPPYLGFAKITISAPTG